MPQSAAGTWWGDSTRYNHFMTFFRVEGWAAGHRPGQWCPKCNSSLAVQLVRAQGGHKEEEGGRPAR